MVIQTMENNEEILQALHEFKNMSNGEKFLSQDLEDMLSYIAKTGRVLFPWNSLKPVFLFKLDKVMREFFESSPSRNASSSEPTVTADFEVMRQRLLDCLDSFTSAPFTIQRLCELMVEPRKNYSNSEKFMRGVEKNVLVVSTVDISRDDISVFSLTNDIDGQHRLSSVHNGPVTNGVMTHAAPSEGSSVADHGYGERLSPHITQGSLTTQAVPDTNGSTSVDTQENGHGSQAHNNNSTSSANADNLNLPQHPLTEEKSEKLGNKVEGHVDQEEAPDKNDRDDKPKSILTGIPTEQKDSLSQEGGQVQSTAPGPDSVCQETSQITVDNEGSKPNEDEPMEEN